MVANNTVDYCRSAFKFENLDRIHGKPTFETICRLARQLQVNAQCVHSDLSGGAHGHLGLVLSPNQYALHSNAPYNKLNDPGILVIPPGTTLHMVHTLKEQHQERLRVFREVQGVEQALRQQIITAIEPQYLDALCDAMTRQIGAPIYTILKHLRKVYGRVIPQQLIDQETKVRNMTYDPINPINSLFSAINKLTEYAEAAGTLYTQAQIVNVVYIILNKTGLFQWWILDWNSKPPIQKTGTAFKIHFRDVHLQLKEMTPLQEQQTPYQANTIKELLDEY